MKRANVPIREETKKLLKIQAAEEGITMTELLEKILKRELKKRHGNKSK